jgi:phosphotransferase system HPr (HPr) family protein
MSKTVLSQRVVVTNPQGLHARPADMLVRTASQFQSQIEIVNGSHRADGKSILGVLTLVAEQGTELQIEASGPDAQDALKALVELIENNFGNEGHALNSAS